MSSQESIKTNLERGLGYFIFNNHGTNLGGRTHRLDKRMDNTHNLEILKCQSRKTLDRSCRSSLERTFTDSQM